MTVKKGYWGNMENFDPAASIRVNYEYAMTGIVRAINGDQQFGAGLVPDHSPVSSKWELYLINVTETQPAYLRGDVNGSGNVNIEDVTTLIDILLGNGEINQVADCNLDGYVNIGDVTDLIDFLLGAGWPN